MRRTEGNISEFDSLTALPQGGLRTPAMAGKEPRVME